MNAQCGICEYKGELASVPLFICLNCADAIRRLVWIRAREEQAKTAQRAISQPVAAAADKAAAPYRR